MHVICDSDFLNKKLLAAVLPPPPYRMGTCPSHTSHQHKFPVSCLYVWVKRDIMRVIVLQMWPKMKERLHSSHIGVNGCLRRARECMYRPNMTAELKEYISQCQTCSKYEARKQKESLMSHEIAECPWKKIGTDLHTIDGQDNFIVVDYFSNFWEIDHLLNATVSTVIKKLKCHFARQGIPDIVISDNGLKFPKNSEILPINGVLNTDQGVLDTSRNGPKFAKHSAILPTNGVLKTDQGVLDTSRQTARQKKLLKRPNDSCERWKTPKVAYTWQYWHIRTPLLSQWEQALPNGCLAGIVRHNSQPPKSY